MLVLLHDLSLHDFIISRGTASQYLLTAYCLLPATCLRYVQSRNSARLDPGHVLAATIVHSTSSSSLLNILAASPWPRLATEIQVPLRCVAPGIRQRESFPFRFVVWRCVGREVLTRKREVPEGRGREAEGALGVCVCVGVRACWVGLMWRGGRTDGLGPRYEADCHQNTPYPGGP